MKYDPGSKTLTLDKATIKATGEAYGGLGIQNHIDGLTIRLVGNNTITSEKSGGIYNKKGKTLTITGNGELTIEGSTTPGNKFHQNGIRNLGTIIVSGCTVKASGITSGLVAGYWKFDRCVVKAKGGKDSDEEVRGSIAWTWNEQPELIGCKIIAPEGAYWKKFERDGHSYYSIFGKDDKIVTDWVTIADPAGINTLNADAKQGIYTLRGVKLNGEGKDLPKGIYIVNGKKVIKK